MPDFSDDYNGNYTNNMNNQMQLTSVYQPQIPAYNVHSYGPTEYMGPTNHNYNQVNNSIGNFVNNMEGQITPDQNPSKRDLNSLPSIPYGRRILPKPFDYKIDREPLNRSQLFTMKTTIWYEAMIYCPEYPEEEREITFKDLGYWFSDKAGESKGGAVDALLRLKHTNSNFKELDVNWHVESVLCSDGSRPYFKED